MFKKKFILVLVLILVTGLCATVLASETTSNWSPSYGGANFQYVNSDGYQQDYNILRWYNTNPYRVSVSYKLLLSNGSTTGNLQYLAAKGYQGYVLDISHPFGARVVANSVVVKQY